jgi:hypothetical protein
MAAGMSEKCGHANSVVWTLPKQPVVGGARLAAFCGVIDSDGIGVSAWQ